MKQDQQNVGNCKSWKIVAQTFILLFFLLLCEFENIQNKVFKKIYPTAICRMTSNAFASTVDRTFFLAPSLWMQKQFLEQTFMHVSRTLFNSAFCFSSQYFWRTLKIKSDHNMGKRFEKTLHKGSSMNGE